MDISERNKRICRARDAGETVGSIAKIYGVSKTRVRQILLDARGGARRRVQPVTLAPLPFEVPPRDLTRMTRASPVRHVPRGQDARELVAIYGGRQ